MTRTTMMLDHPAWLTDDNGRARRVVRLDGEVRSIVCTPNVDASGHAIAISGGSGEPSIDLVDPGALDAPAVIGEPLCADGPVSRLRNPDLWDALATSIIRQVIRAGTARKQYREFCRAHGEEIETSAGPAWLFPTPDVVLGLPDDAFDRLRMRFKMAPLRAAAEWVLKYHDEWSRLPAEAFVTAVQRVPRIGPWSAHATVADLTNRFDLYPFADLAVRTWAKRLAPSITWPDDEPAFGAKWQGMAGTQLSEWTLLTLAWGVRHATDGVAF